MSDTQCITQLCIAISYDCIKNSTTLVLHCRITDTMVIHVVPTWKNSARRVLPISKVSGGLCTAVKVHQFMTTWTKEFMDISCCWSGSVSSAEWHMLFYLRLLSLFRQSPYSRLVLLVQVSLVAFVNVYSVIFRFPRDGHRYAEWLRALGKQDAPPPESAMVCSQHFLLDDFEAGSGSQLRANAVPSTVQVTISINLIFI